MSNFQMALFAFFVFGSLGLFVLFGLPRIMARLSEGTPPPDDGRPRPPQDDDDDESTQGSNE